MPQRRAAKKALRQTKKRRARNLALDHAIRTVIKKFKKNLEQGDATTRAATLKQACAILDKAVSKKLIHINTAARKKSRLTALLQKTPTPTT